MIDRRWRCAAPVAVRLALPLLLAAAACRPAGPDPGAAPAPPSAIPPPQLVGDGTARPHLDPGPIAPLRIEVTGIDPVLHGRPALAPEVQTRVDFWIDFWRSRGAADFQRYLERMARYEAFVDGELERRGLPSSLRYLPIVESGYRPDAVSWAGATGLWQLMAGTARLLGLSVGGIVDDRRDPVASTRAALDYLEGLHAEFGSWYLALSAYNAGRGRVRGVIRRESPSADLPPDEVFLRVRAGFPAETRDFVPKLLAAAFLARDPEGNGFSGPGAAAPLAFDEVVVPDATSLDVVASAAGVPEGEVAALNPQFRRGFTPVGERRVVRVPAGTGDEFEKRYAEIPPEERLSFLEHVVASGETFTHIARRYGVPLRELMDANPRVDPRRLQIGARVVVPVAGGERSGS